MPSICWIVLFAVGCKTLSLPAIDPNGGRIFSGQHTTLISPHSPGSGYLPQGPAFQTPPEPKKCLHGEPMGADGAGSGCKLCHGLAKKANKEDPSEIRGRCGELLLTPTRIVAPVGGEVILLAGVCGKDGMLVTGEPIEWMLSPESVGQIIEVGDDAKGQRRSYWSTASTGPKVEKVAVDFARGRTSQEEGRITRGTARRDDDLPIRKGQTWLSLSSPSEGVSKVTVMAPNSDAWDKRRQTATIYWVDASWDFPRPQLAQSGQPATLVTKVLRAEGFAPAEGWIVRYRSLNPELARFLPGYAEVAEQQVDRNGNAIMEVVNMVQPGVIASSNGTALIEIEISRPAQATENMPELPLARGTVEVTWNAPDLNLRVSGPEIAVPGQPLAYAATLENVGFSQAENTILSMAIPNGMSIQQISVPPTRQTASALAWEIGPLGPRQAFDVEVVVVATTDMDSRIVFEATHAPGVQRSAVVSTLVQKPQLILSVQPDPSTTQVSVGDVANFNMKLTNTGNQTITDVVLVLDAKPGLAHVRDGASQVTRQIGFITPGQSLDVTAQFVVQREGELELTATAQAIQQVLASGQAFVRGVPATVKQPKVELDLSASTGANAIPINTESVVQLIVRNTGPIAIRDLVASIKYDPALVPRVASAGYEQNLANQTVWWRIPELPAGTNIEFKVNFTAASATPNAQVVAQVETGDRTIREMRNVGIPVMELNSGSASGGTIGGSTVIPPSTDLMVAIEPVKNSVRLNDQSQYVIRIRNQSAVNQQRVELMLQLPEGVRVTDLRGQTPGNYSFDETGRRIETEPIQTLRPQEEYSYNLYLRHELVSEGRLTATVRSANAPDPVSAASSITTMAP